MAHRIFTMSFAKVYPLYVQKAEKKGRTKAEVDQIITWLTGYKNPGSVDISFEEFFAKAPALNPKRELIKGVVCGIRVEDVEDPLMKEIRYMDKMIEELARGKKMETILRA